MRAQYPDPSVGVPPGYMPPSYDAALLQRDSWDCQCDPPHGVRLQAERLFVRIRHFPGEGIVIAVMPINPDNALVKAIRFQSDR